VEEEYVAPIITAGGAALAALITALGGLFIKKRGDEIKELKGHLSQAENMMSAERQAMRFEYDFAMSARMQMSFRSLCEETEVDRILMLIAWNGESAPQWTKAEYQYRYGEQDIKEYIHTSLDDDYRTRLNDIQDKPDGVVYSTDDDLFHGTLIKNIYEAEGVKTSMWVYLRKMRYESGVCYSYFSFASHTRDSLSPATRLRIRLLVDELRGHTIDSERR
jgi:hypothetical protein